MADLAPWVTVGWFAVTGAVLFVVAHLYASGLIAAARYPAALKYSFALFFCVAFGSLLVNPLFGALWFQRTNGFLFTMSWFDTIAMITVYAISIAPALYVVLVKRMAALRAAGWFLSET